MAETLAAQFFASDLWDAYVTGAESAIKHQPDAALIRRSADAYVKAKFPPPKGGVAFSFRTLGGEVVGPAADPKVGAGRRDAATEIDNG